MHENSLPYIIPLLLVIGLCLLLSIYLFRERKHADIKILLSVVFLSAGWAAGYSFEMLSANIDAKIAWAIFQYPFICLLPVAYFAFAMRVAGLARLLTPQYLGILCTLPIIMQPVIWTNNWHHWFWRDYRLLEDGPFLLLDFDYGPGFWIINIYSLILLGISGLYLISVGSFTKNLHFSQRLIMIIMPIFPGFVNFLYTQRLGPIPNLDLTPFALLVAGLALAYGFALFHLNRVVLVARGDILDKLPQATFILDNSQKLIDANQSALDLCDIDLKIFIGKSLADIPSPLLRQVSHSNILDLNGTEISYQGKLEQEETYLISATSIEEVKQSIGIVLMLTEISEQKRSNNLLLSAQNAAISARIEAEAANSAKSKFLSQMSHELRTPLNAILGFSTMLIRKSESRGWSEQERKHLRYIESGGKHLVKIIDDILNLAAIEVGKVNLKHENIEPLALVDECIGLLRSLALDRNIQIICESSLHLRVNVIADRVRLKQIIINLLSNAIKYNRNGGTVDILSSLTDSGALRISIKDSGDGIEEKWQAELFQPFSRLGKENTDIEGSGIGLTLSKTLAELMSGHIGFISQKGLGSTFWIDLPLSNLVSNTATPTSAPQYENTRTHSGDKDILYIEDNISNITLMESIIETIEGVNLSIAKSAERGLEMIRDNPPALVLMDINLPGMSGIEALKRLKSDPLTENIPVIAVSAVVMKTDIENGLAAGFIRYLTKPLDISETISVIKKILQ